MEWSCENAEWHIVERENVVQHTAVLWLQGLCDSCTGGSHISLVWPHIGKAVHQESTIHFRTKSAYNISLYSDVQLLCTAYLLLIVD